MGYAEFTDTGIKVKFTDEDTMSDATVWAERYGKPVTALPGYPSEQMVRYARRVYGEQSDYGVVIDEQGGTYLIEYTDNAAYRDSTLVPFHAFYDACVGVRVFGPDVN